MRVPSEPPVPWADASRSWGPAPGRGLAAQLADGLDHLRHAAAVAGMVVAQAPAVGVEGELAVRRLQCAVQDELPALALLAEAEILDLLAAP